MAKMRNWLSGLFGKPRKQTIDIVFPTSWETMTLQQFRDVCQILSSPHGRHETLFLCLCKLSGIRPDVQTRYDPEQIKGRLAFIIDGKSYIIGAPAIREACSRLEFILDGIGLPPSPFADVDRKLYGVSFGRYYTADSYMLRASAEHNQAYIKEAVKVLTDGRKRKLLPWERQAAVIWWNGVKRFLMDKYPHVLEEGESISDRSQADILQDILSAMNGNRPQENESILGCDVHSVLYSLNAIYRNAKQKSNK